MVILGSHEGHYKTVGIGVMFSPLLGSFWALRAKTKAKVNATFHKYLKALTVFVS